MNCADCHRPIPRFTDIDWDGVIVCTPCARKRRDEALTAEQIAKAEALAQRKPDAIAKLADMGVINDTTMSVLTKSDSISQENERITTK